MCYHWGVFVLSFSGWLLSVCVCVVFERVMHVCVRCGVGTLWVTKSNLLWSNQSQCLPSHISGRALRSARARRPSHTHTYILVIFSHTHTLSTPTIPLQGTLHDLSPLVKSQSPQHLHHGWRDHSGKQETEVSVLSASPVALWFMGLGSQGGSTWLSKISTLQGLHLPLG